MKQHMGRGHQSGIAWHRRAGCLLAALTAATSLTVTTLTPGCSRPGPDSSVGTAQSDQFAALFSGHCSGCHGSDGRLGPAPPTNDPLFAALIPEQDLRQVLNKGRPGRLMPGWSKAAGGPLSDEQIDVLTAGIRARGQPEATIGLPPYRAPQDQVGNSVRGHELFNTHCAVCHGQDGQGSSKAGRLDEAAFLELIGGQELRRIAITGRPDLDMPDLRTRAQQAGVEPLNSQQIQDVVAWLQSLTSHASASSQESASQEIGHGGPSSHGS